MIVQLITYETGNASLDEFKKGLAEIQQIYINNGCASYEVYQDQGKPGCFIEIAYFETKEIAERFEKLDSPGKREAFNKFCEAGKVISQTVKVITGERCV